MGITKMGTVFRFPRQHVHARASKAVSRAANAVNLSAVTPFNAAFSVARREDHHSAGMLSRCHHLVTTDAGAPTSAASAARAPQASFGPQSSITARKELISVMGETIGQSVLKRKDFLSLDRRHALGHNVRMADSGDDVDFK